MRGADIVVAGAGAVGRAVALTLARAGHRVAVVDPLQASASSVAAGMLAPAFETLFDAPSADCFALLREARDLWPPLATGIGLPLARDGALAIGTADEAQGWAARLAAAGAEARLLAPAALAQVDPRLAGGDRWGVFTTQDWRLAPAAALARLRTAAEAAGVRFLQGQVVGFEAGKANVAGGVVLAADRLVIATGADRTLAVLAPELDRLTPIKGHILRAEGPFRPAPVIRAGGAYLCRGQGEAVLGSTMEAGVADPAVDAAMAARLLEAARPLADLVPASVGWTAAAGVRAATPDGLPLAGPAGAKDVILAAGARRNGWLLAPLIAQAVLDAVEGGASTGAAARFDAARFAAVSKPG